MTFRMRILSVLIPLAFTGGCVVSPTSITVEEGQQGLEFSDAEVWPAIHVPNLEALRRSKRDPVVVAPVGPATVECSRDGAMAFILPNGDRMPLPPPGESADHHPSLARDLLATKDDLGLVTAMLLPGFAATPIALLPSAVADLLREPDVNPDRRRAAVELAKHLLSGDRVWFDGTVRPSGRLRGWMTLTPGGRQKLSEALRARMACEEAVAR